MAEARKVIITCAVTGSIHTPSMSEHLPVTPAEIAASAIQAAQAGASVLHLHARDPLNGKPTAAPEVFAQFLPQVKRGCDAVISITTGGSQNMTVRDRMQAAATFQPEMCSLNMGSMNFGLYRAMDRIAEWRHAWEPEYLENSRDGIFRNTFKDIECILSEMGGRCGTRFEFECYDVGHLYNLAHFLDRKLVEPPLFVQTIFGILGGIGTDIENLLHMRRIADKLFGDAYEWSILAAGRHQTNFVTTGAIMGGHVRVGLEDSLYLAKGEMARTNADQVGKIRRIVEELSLQVAAPSDARQILQLKGAENVAF